MLTNDFYLFDAGWFFFAAWGVILAVVGVTAFGRDFLPPRALELTQQDHPSKSAQSADHLS